MKSLLIKIGKAISVLKRDGIFSGGRRIADGVASLFRIVGSGDVLFIAGGVGDSARYRTKHVSEELEIHGFRCSTVVQDNPFLPKYADKFKVFVFHRVLFTPSVQKMIERIKKQNKEIIFETDDLIFDAKYFGEVDYFKNINALEKKLYEKGVGIEILKDDYVKICTTTTTYLAEKLREYGKRVLIVPNKLCNEDLAGTEKIVRENLRSDWDRVIRVGYFSGTLSHNKDFATITDALMEIMEKYSQVELFLVGPLDVEHKLNKFKERIKQFPYVPREKHFENVASVDINLAPLEMGNNFCEAKSELKFFEAGIVGVPTVAVANQTFREAMEDGVDGFLASNTQEWVEKIEKLILDENLRKEMGARAYEKTLNKYTNKHSNNEEYYNYLRSKL